MAGKYCHQRDDTIYTAIPLLWDSHGKEFAEEVYYAYKLHAEKKARPSVSFFNSFLVFLSTKSTEWPAHTFQNPIEIQKCFLAFMLHYFIEASQKKLDISSQIRGYVKFIYSIDEAFIESGIWVKPFSGSLPTPSPIGGAESETHIHEDDKGILIKSKLITPIPLHVTDTDAIKLLFKQINSDITLVCKWARREAYLLRSSQLERDQKAKKGTPLTGVVASKERDTLNSEDICATLEQLGLKYIRESLTKRDIKRRIKKCDIAPHLALPGIHDLMPFKLLLVHSDPQITNSFLENFELYNKNHQLSGFLKTDGMYQLIGYKDRRGGDLSEQKINLHPRQAVLVRQVIAITEPLRNELKAAGDDNWRYLFLHSTHSMAYPVVNNPKTWGSRLNEKGKEKLIDQFSQHTLKGRAEINNFINGLSITSFRASCGVETYIKTKSEREMAKVLGHAEYSPGLLSRYLPEPILAFFQSRWVRIFQRGIVCQAMKDSPMLLEATNFTSMEELHEFLQNHALKDIPTSQSPKEKTSSKAHCKPGMADVQSVLVSVDIGILTALLSINAAVEASDRPDKLNGLALYWSEFSTLLAEEIERGWDQDLKSYLVTARENVNPARMEGFVHEPAT